MKTSTEFVWGALSLRQRKILSWWCEGSPFADYNGIIADGAIRSGKTISMSFSFVLWAMSCFDGQQFAMSGKTIESLRRNVITLLKRQLRSRGYIVRERKSENLMIVSDGEKENSFYFFGGKDERSQDLIQGITLAGAYFDEVALMPQSFVNQATARCSVDGSKFWFNCNPSNPQHWFYQDWVLRCQERRLVYLHFMMTDNLTLTPAIRTRYEAQYSGVFYQRYIQGQWVLADGLIYDMFDKTIHVLDEEPETEGDYFVSSDFGIQNASVFLLWRRERGSDRWVCLREYYYSGRDQHSQKTVQQLSDGLQMMLAGVFPKQIIIDPSAAALIVELRRRGYKVIQADNDVLDGIQNVSTMLYQNKLAFCKCCRNTLDEFGVYCWDSKAAEHGEDRPTKTNDHAMDAVRYFVKTKQLVKKSNAPSKVTNFL